MRNVFAFAIAFTVVGCAQDSTQPTPSSNDHLAPLITKAPAIPNRYIVVLKSSRLDARGDANELVTRHSGKLGHVYEHGIKGFSTELTTSEVDRMRADPRVDFIEQDQIVRTTGIQSPAPSIGLDRIDQRNLPLSNSYTYTNTGAGVHLYVLDSGILLTHTDLSGRLGTGYDVVTPGGTANDCKGHGTHVATTAAGTTYGVAKGMTVHPIRVLDCFGQGTVSGIIAGINWVNANRTLPAVSNMSIGGLGGTSSSLDAAVNSLTTYGIVAVVAAGNDSDDACDYSPSRAANAIAVGATTQADAKAWFTNIGSCVKVFAPGVPITAGWIGSPTATAVDSGTSMAAPHVAGWAGLYLESHPTATPAEVEAALIANSTPNKVTGLGGFGSIPTPNRLLFSGIDVPATISISGTTNWTGGNPWTPTSVQWTANATGGTGTYSYQWSIAKMCPGGAAPVLTNATSATVTGAMYSNSGEFYLRVVVTSGSAATTTTIYVNNPRTGTLACSAP